MNKKIFFFIVALCTILLLKILIIVSFVDPWEPDAYHYYHIAEGILDGKGFGGILSRPPVYPLFLAAVKILSSGNEKATILYIKLIQFSLNAFTALLVFLISRGAPLALDNKTAAIAAIICLLDPFLTYFSGKVMTETLGTFLIMLFVYLYSYTAAKIINNRGFDKNSILLIALVGMTCGVAVLTRAAFLGYIFFLSIVSFVFNKKGEWARIFSLWAGIFVFMFLSISPWMYRNYRLTHRIIISTVQGGWHFLEGFYSYSDDPKVLDQHRENMSNEVKGMSVMEADRYCFRKAISIIKQEPFYFLKLCILKFLKFWRIMPNPYNYGLMVRMISAVFFLPLLLLSIIGLLYSLKEPRRFYVLYSMLIYFPIQHSILFCQTRYRVPLHAVLAIFAAYGVNSILQKIKEMLSMRND
jgi:4-amino-4-deoxy-L-arabinose transferase-like glycosyltransferase